LIRTFGAKDEVARGRTKRKKKYSDVNATTLARNNGSDLRGSGGVSSKTGKEGLPFRDLSEKNCNPPGYSGSNDENNLAARLDLLVRTGCVQTYYLDKKIVVRRPED